MANNVRVTELDFDQIKSNLKDFLRAQPEFTDYDFDASNLSVLVDLLAYNTHYNAVLANMVSNEMFLDTALKRSSVVSLAKNIGYTPRSITSARAIVNVTLQNVPGSPNYITLNPYTPFSVNIDGTTYIFYNSKAYTTTPVSGIYTFSNVELYQGRKLDYYYTITDNTPTAKYIIPNLEVDTSTLQVSIQYGGTGSYLDTYDRAGNVTDLNTTSKVYFLQENTSGYYEVYFGDGVIGRRPSIGDVVKISYLISDGDAANVSTNVNLTWSTNAIAGETSGNRTIQTVSKPSGGSKGDSIEDIRFYSINNYEAQNRAVTKNDYASIILQNLPGANSVIVWGGENYMPPKYGTTLISIQPKTGYVLTDIEKTRIINEILKPRAMVTAKHEFIDPDYTWINFKIQLRYQASKTSLSANQLSSLANNALTNYMNANLGKFNAKFYASQLEEILMNIDDSIISANASFSIQKRLALTPGVRVSEFAGFTIPVKVHPNQLRTSYVYYQDVNGLHVAQVRDVPDQSPPDYNGTGTLKTVDLYTGEILDNNVGTVYYAQGIVTLNPDSPLVISGYLGSATEMYVDIGVQEGVYDVFPDYNEILLLSDATADTLANIQNGVTIDVIAVTD